MSNRNQVIGAVMLMSCWACGGSSLPTAPRVTEAPPISAPPANPSGGDRRITVGETVEGALCCDNGSHTAYTLTAPSDGTLAVHLSWNTNLGVLEMYVDDAYFHNFPNSSPLVGKVRVVAGRTYRIRVVDGAPWGYGVMNVPFALTAALD